MTKKFLSSLLVLAALCAPAYAEGISLPKGTKAPKIEGEAWIGGGKDAKAPSDKELSGKVLVLEFFAYW